jgi:hypothetical protein
MKGKELGTSGKRRASGEIGKPNAPLLRIYISLRKKYSVRDLIFCPPGH